MDPLDHSNLQSRVKKKNHNLARALYFSPQNIESKEQYRNSLVPEILQIARNITDIRAKDHTRKKVVAIFFSFFFFCSSDMINAVVMDRKFLYVVEQVNLVLLSTRLTREPV